MVWAMDISGFTICKVEGLQAADFMARRLRTGHALPPATRRRRRMTHFKAAGRLFDALMGRKACTVRAATATAVANAEHPYNAKL